VPGFREQLLGLPRNAIARPGADPTYADGDDATWRTVNWPAITRGIVIAGRRVNVVDTGSPAPRGSARPSDRPALLFLHGLGGLWQNWLLNIPVFMGSHRVIAPDLPGFGRSEMPAGRISIQGYARIVDELCRELGVEDPVVIGNSMGGFIGAELALAFPTRVRRLVLVSAAGLSVDGLMKEPLMTLARIWSATATRTGARAAPAVHRLRLRRVALQTVVRYPEKLSVPLASELVAGSGTPGFVGGLDAVLSYKIRERLSEIEIPTLIVWGRNDILVPVGDAAEFERLIGANAHAVIFEDTGHLSMLERPSRFNELLGEFIAGSDRPEAGVRGVISSKD
jgi:pimeloyl-ACP methyl ester carboxylesterase